MDSSPHPEKRAEESGMLDLVDDEDIGMGGEGDVHHDHGYELDLDLYGDGGLSGGSGRSTTAADDVDQEMSLLAVSPDPAADPLRSPSQEPDDEEEEMRTTMMISNHHHHHTNKNKEDKDNNDNSPPPELSQDASTSSSPQISISSKIYDDIFQLEVGHQDMERNGGGGGGGARDSSSSVELDIYDDAMIGKDGSFGDEGDSQQHQEDEGTTMGKDGDGVGSGLMKKNLKSSSSNSNNNNNKPIQTTNGIRRMMTESDDNNKVPNEESGFLDRSDLSWSEQERNTAEGGGGGGSGGCTGGNQLNGQRTTGPRRHGILIGNLTWWTTDENIQQTMKDIGVDDVLDVKIYDSRLNGQSKGFCLVTFGSEASISQVFEKGTLIRIHDKVPVFKADTKQNVAYFESQSKTRSSNPPNGSSMGGMSLMGGSTGGSPAGYSHHQGVTRGVPFAPAHATAPTRTGWSPHHGPGMKAGLRPGYPNRTYYPMRGSSSCGIRNGHPGGSYPGSSGYHGYHGYNRMMPRAPMSHYSHSHGFYPQPYTEEWPGSRYPYSDHPARGPPCPSMQPHINPAYLSSGRFPSFPSHIVSQLEGSPSDGLHDYSHGEALTPSCSIVSETLECSPTNATSIKKEEITRGCTEETMDSDEFEDLLSRNNSVSTAAIRRAVEDAARGEFASAIETLVTAISLLRNSKIAEDKRCLVLINALQDTLEGIEHRSYGGSNRSSTSSRKDHSRKPYDRAARDRIERSPGRRRSSRGDYPTSLNPDERWDSHRSSSYREHQYRTMEDEERSSSKRRNWDDRQDSDRENERPRKVSRVDCDRSKVRN